MKVVDVARNLKITCEKIAAASAKRAPELQYFQPQLVVSSQTYPPEEIIKVYEAGQRHFSENYTNKLLQKANFSEILEKCKEIQWHFVGQIKNNEVYKLLKVKNLFVVESIDNEKIATILNDSWPKYRESDKKLQVMVHVKTNYEPCMVFNLSKKGCKAKHAFSLVKHIFEECPNLEFVGLGTVGDYNHNTLTGPNPNYLDLIQCRENICRKMGLDPKNVKLSMGLEKDYEHAIELGSSFVQVGNSIFGKIPKEKSEKITEIAYTKKRVKAKIETPYAIFDS